jgi:hypothetical protein
MGKLTNSCDVLFVFLLSQVRFTYPDCFFLLLHYKRLFVAFGINVIYVGTSFFVISHFWHCWHNCVVSSSLCSPMNNKTPLSVQCVGCTKLFKRHSTHLAQNVGCAAHYNCGHTSTAHKESATTPTILNDRDYLREEATFSTCLNLRSSLSRCGLPPDRKSVIVGDNNKLNVNEVDDDFVAG